MTTWFRGLLLNGSFRLVRLAITFYIIEDCEDVRRNMRAVEIDEAHLVVEVAIISYLF